MDLRERVLNFIDSLIPPSERHTNPLLYRTSFLKIALLASLSLIGSFTSFLYAYLDLTEGDLVMAVMEIAAGAVLLLNPFVARKYRNLDLMATVSLLLLSAIFVVAVFDELPEDKSSLIWVNIVPALAFFIKGRRGIYWSLGFLWVHLTLVLSRNLNVDKDLLDAYLSYMVIVVVFYFYAWMSERYRSVWESLARVDSLTGILSRTAFEEIMVKEVERAKRYGGKLSVILFDIDNFKTINDTHGHLFGDRVLKKVANTVRENIRSTDTVARWGGEEFVVLLPGAGREEAVAVAEKLRRSVQNLGLGNRMRITASFGVAELRDGDDSVRLLLKADKALYSAKRNGKNRVEVYREEIPLK
ncbi:MAG: GGDEF domain-containing protein [Aquificota bacterium]|nr:GGDEF domain-containing protein [Aquificota bacterium]